MPDTLLRAERYHDISCGHRVHGHESKCAYLHGHNYRITFTCQAKALDEVGRVIDFSSIKARLCMWLENVWDHKFLAWDEDPIMQKISAALVGGAFDNAEHIEPYKMLNASIVWVPFNPTAENMSQYLLEVIGPHQLKDTGVKLIQVVVEETRKCSASARIGSVA